MLLWAIIIFAGGLFIWRHPLITLGVLSIFGAVWSCAGQADADAIQAINGKVVASARVVGEPHPDGADVSLTVTNNSKVELSQYDIECGVITYSSSEDLKPGQSRTVHLDSFTPGGKYWVDGGRTPQDDGDVASCKV